VENSCNWDFELQIWLKHPVKNQTASFFSHFTGFFVPFVSHLAPLVGSLFYNAMTQGIFVATLSKIRIVMRKMNFLLIASFFLGFAVQAQTVTGVVKDQQGKGLEKSTVSLLRAKDSSVVKLAISSDDGKFSLTAPDGSYLLNVTHIGYTPLYSKRFDLAGSGEVTIESLAMTKVSENLQAVTVTAQKPMVEVRADKMIVNVEGTINAVGNDALELLRKSPGVMVDKDDNLSLAGKNGVQVYVDGKPSPLSGQDLANYLKTLQSAQIEAIEIITNPSAKYEAAGNAGIINIRLKKNKSFGTNGSVSAGYNIGSLPKYNGGISLNHRNQHVNIFGNYNRNYGNNANNFFLRREQFDTFFYQTNRMVFRNNSHGFKGGLDYFINNKSTIGAIVTGNVANNLFNSAGPMTITYMPTNTVDRILDASSRNDMDRTNINTNINYRYSVVGGTDLNIDADYGFFKIRSNQYQPNTYWDPTHTVKLSESIYNMIAPTNIDLYSVKTDYERNYKGGRLGIGGKIAFVNTDNDFQRYNVYPNSKVLDTLKSNRFDYKENINAVYVNYNKAFKGVMIQFGLRVENTHSEGFSTGYTNVNNEMVPYDSTFERDYTNLFPSGAVTFNKNPMSQWNFTYSRRIDRPAYQDLNPFEFKLNEYTFMKGNTQLRPQYTNSFGITHTYKYKLNTTLNYSHVKDIFSQLPDTTEKTKAFLTKKNLATQDIVSLNISYPFQYKWYSFFANVNSYYSHYQADFGGGDRKIDQGVFAMTYYMQNSAKFCKTWTAELSGFYSSPTLWQGVFKSKAMYGIDAGLQKQLLKGKGTVKMSVSDIFRTMKWAGETRFAGSYGRANGNWESRQFKLHVTYRFGSTQVKAARQRATGLDDENKRANTSGGQGGIGQ
jgi:iron complex outermembrane receptor protein